MYESETFGFREHLVLWGQIILGTAIVGVVFVAWLATWGLLSALLGYLGTILAVVELVGIVVMAGYVQSRWDHRHDKRDAAEQRAAWQNRGRWGAPIWA